MDSNFLGLTHIIIFFMFIELFRYQKNKKNLEVLFSFSCLLGGKPATTLPAKKQLTQERERETKVKKPSKF